MGNRLQRHDYIGPCAGDFMKTSPLETAFQRASSLHLLSYLQLTFETEPRQRVELCLLKQLGDATS